MQFELKNTAKSGRVVYTASGSPKEIKAGETRSVELTEGQAKNLKRLADQKSPLLISAETPEGKAVLDKAQDRVRHDPNSRRLPPPDGIMKILAPVTIRDELVDPVDEPFVEPVKSPVERTFAEEFDKPRRGGRR